jgi:hypothetical protein
MQTVNLRMIPTTMDDFNAIRDEIANSPEGGAAVFILAMLMFDKDKKLGEQALTVALDRSNLSESMMGYKGFIPSNSIKYHIDRFSSKTYWGRAYIEGTSPDNAYQLPAELNVLIGRNAYSQLSNGDIKVFVKCSGADTPRPIALRVNDKGIWKAVECSSMFLDMRAPQQTISDDL